MKTLALLARKGGAGKTTLAVHLAVIAAQSGLRVLLVDTDPQRSTAAWWRSRSAATPELVECEANQLPDVLAAARADGIELVVTDSRPSVEADTATVARLSDFVLIPTRPTILDLRAIGATVEVVQAVNGRGAIVMNGVLAGRDGEESPQAAEAREALAAYGIEVAPVAVANRVALGHALVDGRAVTEFDPAGKASAEMQALFRFVMEKL